MGGHNLGNQRGFLNRRLHSLLGVIPVGFFLLEHLLTNYYATKGAPEFIKQVEWIQNLPFVLLLEIFFIFIPILYHGGYGLYIAFQADNNVKNYSTYRNMMFMLQRVTGVLTLAFILWHLWETRVQVAIYHYTPAELALNTAMMLQDNWVFFLYILGVLAAVFHFTNGMWSFLVSWGVTVGPRAQMISSWVWGIVFLFISYIGISALMAFHRPDFIQQIIQ